MGQNHGFLLTFDVVAVFASQHVHLALIEAELAHVSFQKENISALHAWIQNVGGWHRVAFGSAHDLRAFLYSSDVVLTGNVDD